MIVTVQNHPAIKSILQDFHKNKNKKLKLFNKKPNLSNKKPNLFNKKLNLFNKNSNLFNKKPKLFIKRKYQKRYKVLSDFRHVTSSFTFTKLKFYKKKIRVFKKFYSNYAGLRIKIFNKLMEDSVRKDNFLMERRLDIFLCRNFGGSLNQKRKELLEGKILVNGSIKSCSYILQINDFIYWVYFAPWKLKKIRKSFIFKRHLSRYMVFLKKIPGVFFFKNPGWGLAVKRSIWKPIIRSKSSWQLRLKKELLYRFWHQSNIKVFLYKKKI